MRVSPLSRPSSGSGSEPPGCPEPLPGAAGSADLQDQQNIRYTAGRVGRTVPWVRTRTWLQNSGTQFCSLVLWFRNWVRTRTVVEMLLMFLRAAQQRLS